MTPIKNSVRVTAIVTSGVYSLILVVSGVDLDSWEKQILAALPTAAALAVVVFDRWAWKWPPIMRWHAKPRLDGLWRAALTPHEDSHIPHGGNRGPIDAFVVIEQTFWSISIAQFTAESKSYSRTATFIRHGGTSRRSLSFLYDNDPRIEHRQRSPRHVGACELSTSNGAPDHLSGYYFTDRLTKGELRLSLVDRSTNHSDFDSALSHVAER